MSIPTIDDSTTGLPASGGSASAPVVADSASGRHEEEAGPSFASLGVPAPLVKALTRQGLTTAFPIQADTFADAQAGRDLLGRGSTGSGKTLAFVLPMLARLGEQEIKGRGNSGAPCALVLTPTRELASQISEVIRPLAGVYGLRDTTIFGGVSQTRQVAAMRSGIDIVVACPGRLEDLMSQGVIRLNDVVVTVIDEADLMADMGFLPAVRRILRATDPHGQRMLFSATLDNGVDQLVSSFLHDPVLHSISEPDDAVPTMTHHVFEVADPTAKARLVARLASGKERRILFMRTKHGAKRLAEHLVRAGIAAAELHGNLSQHARDRNLAAFEKGGVSVLVATDVASRGIDVPDVDLVVHVDPPEEHKAYLHRSGRTARAGRSGDVVTICLPEQRREVVRLLRSAGVDATPERVDPDSDHVMALVGEIAPRRKPEVRPAEERKTREHGAGNGAGRRRPRRSEARSGSMSRRGEHESHSENGWHSGRPTRSGEERTGNREERRTGRGGRAGASTSGRGRGYAGERGADGREERSYGNEHTGSGRSGRASASRFAGSDGAARGGRVSRGTDGSGAGRGRTPRRRPR